MCIEVQSTGTGSRTMVDGAGGTTAQGHFWIPRCKIVMQVGQEGEINLMKWMRLLVDKHLKSQINVSIRRMRYAIERMRRMR